MAEIVRRKRSQSLTFAGTVGDVLAFQVLHRLLRASPISWWTEFSSDAPQSAPLALALVECVARMDGAVDDYAGGTARAAMATWSIDGADAGSARDGAGQRWRLHVCLAAADKTARYAPRSGAALFANGAEDSLLYFLEDSSRLEGSVEAVGAGFFILRRNVCQRASGKSWRLQDTGDCGRCSWR